MDWLLVLGLDESLVECATVCVKSWVILTLWDHNRFLGVTSFTFHLNTIEVTLERLSILLHNCLDSAWQLWLSARFSVTENWTILNDNCLAKFFRRVYWLKFIKPIHWVISSAQWYVFQRMNSWCQLWQVGKVWWEWYVFQRMKIVQICLLNEWILVSAK